MTEFGPIIAWVEYTAEEEAREHRIEPAPRQHFLSNYYIPEPPPPKPPRPEPKRVVCPACLRKIALTRWGTIAKHGPLPSAYREGETRCPADEVFHWTREGPPRPVTGEARAWLPFLELMSAKAWQKRWATGWVEPLKEELNDDSSATWDQVGDALRAWRVAERNHWERGIPYDFCPEERE